METSNPECINGTVVKSIVRGVPIYFFVNDAGDHIQSYHLKGEFYEPDELALIEKYCPRDAHILDGGANVGNHAVFFEKFLSPKSVKVFEINSTPIELLRINILLNQCRTVDTSYLGIGLADKKLSIDLINSPKGNLGGARFRASATGKFRAVAGDEMLGGAPVNFIKLDVEGMEIDALRGLARTIEIWRPLMFVEIGDGNAQEFSDWLNTSDYSIVERFQRYGAIWNYVLLPN